MTYDTKTVVAIAALLIDEYGYRKDYGNGTLTSTKSFVKIMYHGLFGGMLSADENAIFKKELQPLINKSATINNSSIQTLYNDEILLIHLFIRNGLKK